jgi:hypothetical protein
MTIRVTWAATSWDPAERIFIGKVQAAIGKWPVSAGAMEKSFAFEVVEYADLSEYAKDCAHRQKEGCWSIVKGSLKPELDPRSLHPRKLTSFLDTPAAVFSIDFDGLPPHGESRIDGPEAFGAIALKVALSRLPQPFLKAACVAVASASTGLPFDSNGEPSNGCARFRAAFHLSRPLTFAEQKILAEWLKRLPGLDCIDLNYYTVSGFEFISRPQFLPGVRDPIDAPIFFRDGGQVDVSALFASLGANGSYKNYGPKPTPEELRFNARNAIELVKALMDAVPNNLDRPAWIGVGHALKATLGDCGEAWEIWIDFSDRWTEGRSDFDENDRVWGGLHDGRVGIGYLVKLGTEVGTPEALAAVQAIQQARAKCDFTEMSEEELAESEKTAEPRDRWAKLRAALQWSGKEKLVRNTNTIAWREPGIAVFGCGAATGNAVERRWVSDRHARGHVSVTNGSPAVGKTFFAVTYANAIAAEKPLLAGLDRIERAGAAALMAADGERAEEFQRKDQAFRQYHNLSNDDFRYPVYVFDNVGPFVEKKNDVWVPSLWLIGIAPKLAEMRERERLALVVVDTLLGVSGGGNTADATDMQAIMEVTKMIATELDCAVEILNHLTKGGARNNPSDMDAGLGARPLTATPRFVANLTREGAQVRVAMAKASYIGGPRGTPAFQFQSVRVPVDVDDVDGSIVTTEMRPLGVLVPSSEAALRSAEEADAHKALWEAHENGVEIKRGSASGLRKDDHASSIVQTALRLGRDSKARKKAEGLIEALIDQGFVRVVERQGKQRRKEAFLEPEPFV